MSDVPIDGLPTVRSFLLRYTGTVVALGVGVVLLGLVWGEIARSGVGVEHPWPAAVATVFAWIIGVGTWLRRLGMRRLAAHVLPWALPAAVLAMPAAAGWLSPAGLVVWGPVATVLVVALTMSAQPQTLVAGTR